MSDLNVQPEQQTLPGFDEELAAAVERSGGGVFLAKRLKELEPAKFAAVERALSEGIPETVAARVFLLSVNTVRAIRDNQLANSTEYAQSVAARARVNALRASEELNRRIAEKPEALTTGELIKLAESGHALQQDQQQEEAPQVLKAEGSISIHFGQKKNQQIIDITPAAAPAEIDS
jgi:hypothetical protein